MSGILALADIDLAFAAALDEQLEEVGVVLERQLASDHSPINALCRHIEHYQGKRLRPLLVLSTGIGATSPPGDVESLTEKHRVVAAVVEMIHLATLVHDDVLDQANLRRRVPTLNRMRGNETAVMLGDYLISNSFHLCSSLMEPEINLALGEVTNTLCTGELLQLHHRDDCTIDEQAYSRIVESKTASLIGASCRLGAQLSGADAVVCEAMHRFGLQLGIAFQIQDDLLDVTGDESVVGKSLGRDLDSGKVTLPLIRYLATADDPGRRIALERFAARDAVGLRKQLLESGAVAEAQARATVLVTDAKSELNSLAPSPARDLLEALADAVVTREF